MEMTGLLALSTLVSAATIGPYLYVDLQDGFEGLKTFVYLEDSLVYRGSPATDPLTGLAQGLELMGRSSSVGIRVRIPGAGIDSTFSVDIPAGEFLGVSITGAGGQARSLSLIHSGVPFGYD